MEGTITATSFQYQNQWNWRILGSISPSVAFFPVLWAVMNKRGTTASFDPLPGNEHLLMVEKNILTNTVEQLMLYLLVSITLATYLDRQEMRLFLLFASVWVIGRVLFSIGYRINFKYQTLGMMCNIVSTCYFSGLICYFLYSRGLWYGVATTTVHGSINNVWKFLCLVIFFLFSPLFIACSLYIFCVCAAAVS